LHIALDTSSPCRLVSIHFTRSVDGASFADCSTLASHIVQRWPSRLSDAINAHMHIAPVQSRDKAKSFCK